MRSHAKAPSAGSVWIAATIAFVLSLLLLAMSSAPALAAQGHPYLEAFSAGAGSQPGSITTDGAGNVYVEDDSSNTGIEKFDASGNPVNFSASGPYISGNKLLGTSAGSFHAVDFYGAGLGGVGVDASGGLADGSIYVVGSYAASEDSKRPAGGMYTFDSSGAYRGLISMERGQGSINNGGACSVGISQGTGDVVLSAAGTGTIPRYSPVDGNPANDAFTGALLAGPACGVAADSTGAIYVGSFDGTVKKYDASQVGSASPVGTEITNGGVSALAINRADDHLLVDQSGRAVEFTAGGVQLGEIAGIWNSKGVAFGSGGKVYASQPNGSILVFGPLTQLPVVKTEGATSNTPNSVTAQGEIDPDGAGNVTSCEFRWGTDASYSGGTVPCDQGVPITGPTAVSADLEGLPPGTSIFYQLVAKNANGTQLGNPQATSTAAAVEGVATGEATEVERETALLHGSFVGQGEDNHYYFEWGTDGSYGQVTPALPGNDAGSVAGQQEVTPVTLTGLKGGTEYHYRLVVTNLYGKAPGEDRTFTTPPAVMNLTTDPATGITDHSAELHASFDGDSHETSYYFEWGSTSAYGRTTPLPPGNAVAPGGGRVSVPPVGISGLQGGATYHYRVVASSSAGIAFGNDATFRAAGPPEVSAIGTRAVTAESAVLFGEVNARGTQTSYRFDWGPTATYGNSAPVPDGSLSATDVLTAVSTQLQGLTPGVTYHFRLVATNQYGTASSPDQTFGFYPRDCPNAQLRQETGANNLPDCRAYELVSPSNARGAAIIPVTPVGTGYATNPARLAYATNFGTASDEGDPSNVVADFYIASRSDTGWSSKLMALGATKSFTSGGPLYDFLESSAAQGAMQLLRGVQTTPDLSRVLIYAHGWPSNPFGLQENASNAPYVLDASTGVPLTRWPTNLAEIPGGEDYVGVPMASRDFTHYVFSSNVIFSDDGEGKAKNASIACCAGGSNEKPPIKGSIYDNNVTAGTVALASLKTDGSQFEGYVYNVSDDGTQILMGEESLPVKEKAFPLYLKGPLYVRANGVHTYEIAPGKSIRYVGTTADGKTVYLASKEQLTADDHDTSNDLFVWHESQPDTLTRVSMGEEGAGDTDACSASWTEKCGVGIINFGAYGTAQNGISEFKGGNGQSDSFIARDTGDIYFYSPEQLVKDLGEPGAQNLYVYRDGAVHFVTAMEPKPICYPEIYGNPICAEGPIGRMQVTPDGEHMAMVALGHLTAYDSGGFAEMYVYDRGSGRITCASCRPDGEPPKSDVLASQSGLFLTDDGRAFFTTHDPLVSRDTDEVKDVYEFTEGKAQLISAGLGSEIPLNAGTEGEINLPGLIGVSANGTDVYFGTIDNLVTQDHNGEQLKIYDARTGGGYPAERIPARCAAADECHGAGNPATVLPADRTSAEMGKVSKPKAKHKAKKHRAKKHKKRKGHKKRAGGAKKPRAGHGKQGGKDRG